MRFGVAIIGTSLVALGLAVFAWKVFVLDLPISPTGRGGVWQIELRVTEDGQDAADVPSPGSVRVAIPPTRPGQILLAQEISGTGGTVAVATAPREAERAGHTSVWEASPRDGEILQAQFRIKRLPHVVDTPIGPTAPSRDPSVLRDLAAVPGLFPVDAPAIEAALGELDLPPRDRSGERVRVIHAFVAHDVGAGVGSLDSALDVLRRREGSALGRERLLVTLLRAAGIPARLIGGLALGASRPRETSWTEAFVADQWIPMSPVRGFFGTTPLDHVAFSVDGTALIESTGLGPLSWAWHSIQQDLTPNELAALAMPTHAVLSKLSLYRLPVPAQSALRILLLIPLGALVIAVLRNVVGLPSFGTFMPMLIALALRETGLGTGLLLVAAVLGIGVMARIPLQALHLLLVPRLALLLCIVIVSITALSLVGRNLGVEDFYAGIVFPVVILTMLVERVALRISEEGTLDALWLAAVSSVIAVAVYPIFKIEAIEHLMFSFPELVAVVMGMLVWLGGYTGYRLTDLIRFSQLAEEPEPS